MQRLEYVLAPFGLPGLVPQALSTIVGGCTPTDVDLSRRVERRRETFNPGRYFVSPRSSEFVPQDNLLRPLMVLTVTTGVIDAVSFVGLGHVFTANMTGNVVVIGFGLAGAEGVSVARSLVALGSFAAGAVLGGRLV